MAPTSQVLGDRRAIQIIKFLAEKGTAKKSDITPIPIANSYVVQKKLDALKEGEYITIEKIGNAYSIALTDKGRALAKIVRKAEDIASGTFKPETEIAVGIPRKLHENIDEIVKIKGKWKSVDDFVTDAVRKEIKHLEFEGKG